MDQSKKEWLLSLFGANVRSKRIELKLTQRQLAELAGLHINFIGGVERGRKNPSLTSLVSLSGALNCEIEDLLVCEIADLLRAPRASIS